MKINDGKLGALRTALRELNAEAFDLGVAVREANFRVADAISQLRADARLTQAEAAERLGIAQPEFARLESGNGARGPTVSMLERVAVAFGKRLVVRFETDKVRNPSKSRASSKREE